MSNETVFLMSAENPNGAKLEEILGVIVSDLKVKNVKLNPEDGVDKLIMNNNSVIIGMLENSIELQNQTMAIIEKGHN